MAYSETTGLLEINRYRQGRSFSGGDVGTPPDLLERLLGRIRKVFAFGLHAEPTGDPLTKLSDRLLQDIGLTRAEAIELDKRRHA
ncbi:DUF1127 domain-containing protein [Phyllobacterium zundukense]|uniref:DUF1127 domain-containing protein n=1 Tax=Phyllobacterium zundukense TaxID=1867719 RepID=A0ACD4CWI0_9HYPH|nr:DUF1127 domain-containing protein [Phyllobacterium zundukense]UXN57957.1 DUF1127 domain-containing protein [Phyllobacterium zundukense]